MQRQRTITKSQAIFKESTKSGMVKRLSYIGLRSRNCEQVVPCPCHDIGHGHGKGTTELQKRV